MILITHVRWQSSSFQSFGYFEVGFQINSESPWGRVQPPVEKGLEGRLSRHQLDRLGFRVGVGSQWGNGILLNSGVRSPIIMTWGNWRRLLLIEYIGK